MVGSRKYEEKMSKSNLAIHPYFNNEIWQIKDNRSNSHAPRVSACSFLMGVCMLLMGATTLYFFRDPLQVKEDPFRDHLRITGIIFLLFGISVVFCSVLVCVLTCLCPKKLENTEELPNNLDHWEYNTSTYFMENMPNTNSSSQDPLSEYIVNPGYLPVNLNASHNQNSVTNSIFTYSQPDSKNN